MHPPRFPHPNYISPKTQWRPHGPRFSPMWPIQSKYYPNSKGPNFPNNNEDHWCETCDRGFRTLEILLNHKQQHQKCNIDGCQFIAHPKVITKHIQMQHSTGLYKKIAKLDNPEEIQKWREERKKRYPTKENIERRSAEIKEKIERGEKMGMRSKRENKYNGREKGMKRKSSQDINRRNFKKRFEGNKSCNEVHNKTLIDNNKKTPTRIPDRNNFCFPEADNSKALKPFTGIQLLLDDIDNENTSENIEINDSIEEDEYIVMDETEDKNNLINIEPVVCGALSSLICNYESSEEESDQKPIQFQVNESENMKTKNDLREKNTKEKENECMKEGINILNNSVKSDDESGPEEVKIVKLTSAEMNTCLKTPCNEKRNNLEPIKRPERRENLDKNKTNNAKNNQVKYKSKLPSTLLEKLLRNEIRQERNIVLQCIRYIVKNNYFEKD